MFRNFKITRFSYYFGKEWVVVVVVVVDGGFDVTFRAGAGVVGRLLKSNKCKQEGGSPQFGHFVRTY